MPDDSVREIQLNGKQLVFLFMSATLAAAVIFLCGVMVGRGVTAGPSALAEVAADLTFDPTADSRAPLGASVDAPSSTSPSTVEDLSYARRLEAPEPPPEPTVEPVETPTPAVAQVRADQPPEASARPAGVRQDAAAPEPAGEGFVVQVAAVRVRSEAEEIARRLSAKGFPSFVTTPESGAPDVFRVRVGRYPDRREAERVARRLQQEEQFKPWITR
jgi:cell division septation protein DedD